MLTQVYNNPVIQDRINRARKDVDEIKRKALEFNLNIEGLFSSYIKDIRYAILSRRDYRSIIDELSEAVDAQIESILSNSMRLACEREGYDYDTLRYIFPLEAIECSYNHYTDTITKYYDILREEIAFAIDSGYIEDLPIFLSNPQAYMSSKKNGLNELKGAISEAGRGVSYSFSENMKKLGISVAALSYANAELALWKRNGAIEGYFGVRNSDYPCPLCDEYANVFIPISQGMLYPLHNRCVCAVVPLYQNELS